MPLRRFVAWGLHRRGRMIRKLKRRNLGTFETREAAEKHERAVQCFKPH